MSTEINSRIQLLRDTKENWESEKDAGLLDGEIAIIFSGNGNDAVAEIKIGDGVSSVSSLPYFRDPTKVDINSIGKINGPIPLDEKGKIPTNLIPTILLNNYEPSFHRLDPWDYGVHLPTTDLSENRVYFLLKDDPLNSDVTKEPYDSYHLISDNDFGPDFPISELSDGRIFFKTDEDDDKLVIDAKKNSSDTDIHMLESVDYGSRLPTNYLEKGRVFFKLGSATEAVTDPNICKIPVIISPIQKYTGKPITIQFLNYDAQRLTISGKYTATDPGTYTVSFTLNNEDYKWSDNTQGTKRCTWIIQAPDRPNTILTVDSINYGTTLPDDSVNGQIFFRLPGVNVQPTTSSSPYIISDTDFGNELPTQNLEENRVFFKFKEPVDGLLTPSGTLNTVFVLSDKDVGTEMPTSDLENGRIFFELDN